MNRKALLLLLGSAGIVLILAIIAALAMAGHSSNQSQPTAEARDTAALTVSGLDDPKYLFSSDTQSAIQLGIGQYLVADNINTDNITGMVRRDSFKQKQSDDGASTITTLLIDIPGVKRTYKISASGSGEQDGDNSLYILCPSKEDMIYGAFKCKDDTI